MAFCKDCAHYHDTHAEMPWYKRMLHIHHMFDEVCDYVKFADPVDGSPMPCVTARIRLCNGEAPVFLKKQINKKGN